LDEQRLVDVELDVDAPLRGRRLSAWWRRPRPADVLVERTNSERWGWSTMEREDSGRSGAVEICGNAEHMKDGGRSAATEVNNGEAKGTGEVNNSEGSIDDGGGYH
jgi:hypothetical protein